MNEKEHDHPNFSEAAKIERPFKLVFSEHDLRHLRVALRDRAIETTDWGRLRCAVGIYERINEQLTEQEKATLAGPPKPRRDAKSSAPTQHVDSGQRCLVGHIDGHQCILCGLCNEWVHPNKLSEPCPGPSPAGRIPIHQA